MTGRDILIYLSLKYSGDWTHIYSSILLKHMIDANIVKQTVNDYAEKNPNLKIITLVDEDYPDYLKSTPFPPFVVYIKGKEITFEPPCMKKYYVMYWNDREGYPVAVFEVNAHDQDEATDIAYKNGGKQYDNIWPLLIKTDEWMTEDYKKRYIYSTYVDYHDLTKGGK